MEGNDENKKQKKRRPKSTKSASETWKESQYATDAHLVNQRLYSLTGSDEIKMNDPDYMTRLRVKVWEEYEVQQDKKEKARAESERERMRRLMAEGIIGADELRGDRALSREYVVHNHRYHKKGRSKKHNRTRKSSPSRAKSAPQTHSEHKTVSFSAKDTNTPVTRPMTSFTHRGHSIRSPAPSGDKGDQDSIGSYTYSSRRTSGTSRTTISSRYEHPIVQQMRDEESVAGLYDLAKQLIPETVKEPPPKPKTAEEEALEEENKYKKLKYRKPKLKF